VGVPGADRACNAAYAGSAACSYADLIRSSGLGQLDDPRDTANAAVTSWWANDINADIEQQCSHDNLNEAPWTYQTADQGDRGLYVNVADGALSDPQVATCNGGSHWVACCF
jgi:hypothetical protein